MLDLVFVTRVFWRSLAVVRNPALWRLLAIPVAVAVGSLIILLVLALQPLSAQFLGMAPATWLIGIGWTGVAEIFAWVAAWLMLFAISYGLAALVSGLLIVPIRSYADMVQTEPSSRPGSALYRRWSISLAGC